MDVAVIISNVKPNGDIDYKYIEKQKENKKRKLLDNEFD